MSVRTMAAEDELHVSHVRGLWSVSGHGASATGNTREAAFRRWLNLFAPEEPTPSPAERISEPVEALAGAEAFWERYLH